MSTVMVSVVVTVEPSGSCGLYTFAVGDPVCRRISSLTGHQAVKPTYFKPNEWVQTADTEDG